MALVIDDFKLLNDLEARDMVMKFLARKGYVFITGNEFRLESDTQHIDLETLTAYIQINRAIMCGNMADAINSLTVLMPPLVLERNTQLNFRLQQQLVIELIRNGGTDDVWKIARSKFTPFLDHHQTDEFLKEFQKIGYMLLCHDVNKCPYAEELLNVERRREIARDVNELILENAPPNQGLLDQAETFIFSKL